MFVEQYYKPVPPPRPPPIKNSLLRHFKVGKFTEYMTQKLSKNMIIVKFHPGMKCLHIFFPFYEIFMKFHPGENV